MKYIIGAILTWMFLVMLANAQPLTSFPSYESWELVDMRDGTVMTETGPMPSTIELRTNGKNFVILYYLGKVLFMFDPNPDKDIPEFIDSGYCPIGKNLPGKAKPSGDYISFDDCLKTSSI